MGISRFPSVSDAVAELGLDVTVANGVVNDPVLRKVKTAIDQIYNRALSDISRFGAPRDENYEANLAAFEDVKAPLKHHENVALIAQHWIDEAKQILDEIGAFGNPPAPAPTPTETTPTP